MTSHLNSHGTTDIKPEMLSGVQTEMELYMINLIYVALLMCEQTEKMTFSCKDDCILTKHTRRWTYSSLSLQYDLCRTSSTFFQAWRELVEAHCGSIHEILSVSSNLDLKANPILTQSDWASLGVLFWFLAMYFLFTFWGIALESSRPYRMLALEYIHRAAQLSSMSCFIHFLAMYC